MTAQPQMQQQTETAAQQYERLKEQQFEAFLNESFSDEKLNNVPLFEVKVPSGMMFKCRKIDKAFFTEAGVLPLSLMELAIVGDEAGPSDEDAHTTFQSMSMSEKLQAIRVTSQMLRYMCVEPRLVLEVNGHKNAISVDRLTGNDYKHLADWAKQQSEGGNAAAGLRTFRKRRK